MNLIEKYLGESKYNSDVQDKKVKELQKKGFKVVIVEPEFVGMMNKKRKEVAEVYVDGTVKYPEARKEVKDYFSK